MRIKNLNIDSFGKLNSVGIGFDDKITVISGKNEAGKSSIANYIRYMLYGFDASKKADVSENYKKKYMPWDGDSCGGDITFEAADGKVYTAVRKTASRNQNTVFDSDGMPVTTENAGDYFFGINEAAYKRTAFIGQKDTSFTDDGELNSAISNMIYSADESVDSQKALKKLEDIRKYYLGKAERSGQIFEIEKELSNLEAERDKWKDGHKELLSAEYQLSEIQKKIDFNKEKKELLEKERENLEYLEAKKKLGSIEEARKTVEEGKIAFEEHYRIMQNGSFVPDNDFLAEIKSAVSDIAEKKKQVNDETANLVRAKENLDKVYSDEKQRRVLEVLSDNNESADGVLSEIEELRKSAKKNKVLAIVFICLIITIPVAIVFFKKLSALKNELCKMVELYGCEEVQELEAILSQGASFKAVGDTAKQLFEDAKQKLDNRKKAHSESVAVLEALAKKAGFDIKDTNEYLNKAALWLSKTEALKTKCREDFVAYNTLVSSVDMNELSEKAQKFDDSIEIRDIKTVTQQLMFYTQANEALTVRERELEKNAAVLSGTLPKPAEIQSRILSLSAQRDEMRKKHASLCLAIETLEKASENMRNQAAPRIASETSELFSKITDGKYKGLYADNEMKLTFLEKNEAEVRDAGYLSTGTLDAAYISLRIALCEFLYKEHPTLIFDDAFSNMDNERLERTLDFLCELSEDFQIIILSCHDREKKYLKGKAKIIDFAVD